MLRLTVTSTLTWAAFAVVIALSPSGPVGAVVTVLCACLAVGYAATAWSWYRYLVVADDEGIHLRRPWRSRTIRWEQVADVRSNLPAPDGRHLVAELAGGTLVRLPLPAGHEGMLTCWRRVRAQRSR